MFIYYLHERTNLIFNAYNKTGNIYFASVMKDLGVKLDTRNKCDSSGEAWSDSWLECMIRTYTNPQNHQMGTAAIGKVVDPDLKVYNIKGLRVIDASVMPTQVTGNPQAPIMMVAEKGAALIKLSNNSGLDGVINKVSVMIVL